MWRLKTYLQQNTNILLLVLFCSLFSLFFKCTKFYIYISALGRFTSPLLLYTIQPDSLRATVDPCVCVSTKDSHFACEHGVVNWFRQIGAACLRRGLWAFHCTGLYWRDYCGLAVAKWTIPSPQSSCVSAGTDIATALGCTGETRDYCGQMDHSFATVLVRSGRDIASALGCTGETILWPCCGQVDHSFTTVLLCSHRRGHCHYCTGLGETALLSPSGPFFLHSHPVTAGKDIAVTRMFIREIAAPIPRLLSTRALY